MEKNIKIALGCFGSAIFIAGTVVGGLIQERIDKKANKDRADLSAELFKIYDKEIDRIHKENEQLKIRIVNKKG